MKLLFPVYARVIDNENDDETELTSEQSADYSCLIMDAIRECYKYFIYEIAIKGWLTNRELPFPLNEKVLSVFPAVGIYGGELWGVLNCETNTELTGMEIEQLEKFLIPEFKEGYGDIQCLSRLSLDENRYLCVHLMPFFMEQKFLDRDRTVQLLKGIDLDADLKGQEIPNPLKLFHPDAQITLYEKERLLIWLKSTMVKLENAGKMECIMELKNKVFGCLDHTAASNMIADYNVMLLRSLLDEKE